MNKITVIMPCWLLNEKSIELTKNAIDSLGEVNLIIIDNGSNIGGGYLRSKANLYIKDYVNIGFAKAVNQGLKLSDDGLIAIVNNDIRVSPNWQEVVREEFKENDDTFSLHLRMTDYKTPFKYGENTWATGKERWCQGSFFVIDGKKKHLYDEDFLNSYDDWDFLYRARQKDYKTVYTNKASFQHWHSFTQQLIPSQERAANNKHNAEVFKKKHGDYAEDIFMKLYPEQMQRDWKEGFDEGI